ncbi:hypothetical protein H0H81_002856 [Sphagnurus paluster]|uniref:CCZ1/INTU/HSP4 first Longin domain-containing protein n=1 Tax=Sphagnurus paluster TaxID=117069 RepID=A0A9P7GGM5_9AGAR|nr:hypothetical protein H0H81_002856 [Sphagnurus paluster]
MSRVPPNLLYLTIYNPTLQPTSPVAEGDEDAEEQAHILFYTSKERAVSRDRMLRQIGLAKALINFSDMFTGIDTCNNVHSQSKRMIMVSPEPDFWIHAGVEVGKVPRLPVERGKGKSGSKSTEKGKEKERESPETTIVFDYQEGSVHDLALRADILRGYEQFKLTHGSFTSILSKIGREGLQLQLERFFTPWAWSWNLEEGAEFRDHFGIELHPSFRTLVPLLEDYSHHLPTRASSILIQPPYAVPSSQYYSTKYPTSIPRQLVSIIPPTPPASQDHSHEPTSKGRPPSDKEGSKVKDSSKGEPPSGVTFLGMPKVNMHVSMDVRKWGWPGYLTFGKGGTKRPNFEQSEQEVAPATESDEVKAAESLSREVIRLDKGALDDAISEEASITDKALDVSSSSDIVDLSRISELEPIEEISDSAKNQDAIHDSTDRANSNLTFVPGSSSPTPEAPPPSFSAIHVHLADPENPLLTVRQKLFYILRERTMLALVGLDEILATSELALDAFTLLDNIETTLMAELSKTITPDQLSTAAKMLQPTDTHLVSAGQFAISSPNFSSKSGHLYNVQGLQTNDPDISEVFSRGLNPQHWHIARRGLGPNAHNYDADHGEVFMQIFRKEASLSDVDNVLAGVVKRSGLADGSI